MINFHFVTRNSNDIDKKVWVIELTEENTTKHMLYD